MSTRISSVAAVPVTEDRRGVIAADGAERAVVTVNGGDRIDVAIGGDRYRLPATIQHRAS